MRYLIALVFALCLLNVSAQTVNEGRRTNKVVVCWDIDHLLKNLQQEYEEEPVWQGASDTRQSVYMLTMNPKTKEWTLIQFNDRTGCILGIGAMGNIIKIPGSL